MLPKITALFRLTKNPELRFSAQGTAVCKVGLACSEKYGDKETQLFIDGTCFKKTAEMLATVSKGQRVFVTGKINTDSWQDKATGTNRSKTVMIIESFEFIEARDNQSMIGQQQQNNHTQPNQTAQNQPQPSQNQQHNPQNSQNNVQNAPQTMQNANNSQQTQSQVVDNMAAGFDDINDSVPFIQHERFLL